MRIEYLHDWNVNIDQAIELQHKLAQKVVQQGNIDDPRWIAGVDVSVNSLSEGTAVAVILSYPELNIVEKSIVKGPVVFPYVPGLLSFREMPLTLQACAKLKIKPDLLLVDGQGIAHPRHIGLASHLGLFLEIPTIGCAKSSLFGKYVEPDEQMGSYCYIKDKIGKILGAVLRTKSRVKPLFISIGHKIDLSSSIYWVLQCCRGYRLPEPTRLAHLASKGIIN
jgi:deoxyribonuclease V